MFLNQEEKQKTKSERGLELRSVGHRVLATTFTPNEHELSQKDFWSNRFCHINVPEKDMQILLI